MRLSSGSEKRYSCRQVYEEGAAILEELQDGRLDARLLLEHFCGINTNRLLSDPETPVGEENRGAFLEGARRRAAREPLAYIIGEQSFMGLPFVVSEDVLIPEQDTENLVEEALRLIDDGSRILDLCTGSGCILLSLLRYTNGCKGVGTDISGAALEIARRNGEILGLSDRAVWLRGDLFAALSGLAEKNIPAADSVTGEYPGAAEAPVPAFTCSFGRPEKVPVDFGGPESKWEAGIPEMSPEEARTPGFPFPSSLNPEKPEFDLIISNPPYIPTDVIGTLAPEVSLCEPRLALDGGKDGLDFYRRIISEAPDYLVIGGRLMLEIGYDQAEAVSSLLKEAGYYGVEVLRDYGGNDRIVTAVCSMAQKRG